MSKGWMISLAGIVAVLGFAAYMSLKSPTQPAATIRTGVTSVSKPATGNRSPQLSSSTFPAVEPPALLAWRARAEANG